MHQHGKDKSTQFEWGKSVLSFISQGMAVKNSCHLEMAILTTFKATGTVKLAWKMSHVYFDPTLLRSKRGTNCRPGSGRIEVVYWVQKSQPGVRSIQYKIKRQKNGRKTKQRSKTRNQMCKSTRTGLDRNRNQKQKGVVYNVTNNLAYW